MYRRPAPYGTLTFNGPLFYTKTISGHKHINAIKILFCLPLHVLYKNHLRTQTHKRHKKYCFVYPFMFYTKTISGHKHIYAIKILFCLPLHVLYNNHLRTQTHKSHKKYCFVFPFMFSSIDSHLQRENYVHLESYVNFT